MKELALGYLRQKAFSDRDKALMSLKLLTENAVGIGDHTTDRKSTRLNSSHSQQSRMPSSA